MIDLYAKEVISFCLHMDKNLTHHHYIYAFSRNDFFFQMHALNGNEFSLDVVNESKLLNRIYLRLHMRKDLE